MVKQESFESILLPLPVIHIFNDPFDVVSYNLKSIHSYIISHKFENFVIYAEVVNFWGRVEAKGLPAIQRWGCPTEK